MAEVIIFTAPIRSGKTTALMQTFAERNDTAGFLCPDVNGLRHFFDLQTKELLPFELGLADLISERVQIGKFSFDKKVFDRASDMFSKWIKQSNRYIVIDEIGKLELNNMGFEPSFSRFLTTAKNWTLDTKIILVVRNSLLEAMISHYNLLDARVLELNNFSQIDDF